MFSSFKHGVPSTEESAGDKLTSSHALAVSARSLAVEDSEIYALLLNNSLLKLYRLHIQIVLHLSRRGATLNCKTILFLGLSKAEI